MTDTQTPQASFDALTAAADACGLGRERIAAPSLLHISPAPFFDEAAP